MPHPALPALAIIAGFGLALLTSKNKSRSLGAASPPPVPEPTVDTGGQRIVNGVSLGRDLQEAANSSKEP